MYCNRCDAPLPEGIVICPECGARQRRQARTVRCAHCHKRASVELVMCPHCGRDLRPAGPRWGLWLTSLVVVILAGLWGLGRLPIRQIWQEVNDTRARLAELVQIPELPTPVPTPAITRGLAQVQMSPTATPALPGPTASAVKTLTPQPTLAATETPTGVPATPTATPPAAQSYTVKSGDTLAGIGARLGLDWQIIAELNGLNASTVLRVGQQLKLPTPTAQPATPTASPAAFTRTPTTSPPVTAVPSATPAATSKATPAPPAAAATATRVPGPTATPRPRPTATPVPPTPTAAPTLPAPVLVNPADGAFYSGEDKYIVLEWQAVEGLPTFVQYRVTIKWIENGVPVDYHWDTRQTGSRVPPWLWLRADQPARRYTWFVTVVQVTTDGQGGERVIELSPPSETRSLSWN